MKMKSCLIFICFVWASLVAVPQNRLSIDSLKQELAGLSDLDRLAYLDTLVTQNTLSTSRLLFARLLEEEALRQQNGVYLANAYYMFVRHYYSVDADSMRYWTQEAEPLFLSLGRLEDLCRMKAWNIYILNREGEKEKALDAVAELKLFSNERAFPEGAEMADQAMADFYFSNKLYDEAEALYQDVLGRMKARNAPMIKQFNIVRQLFGKMPTAEGRLKYLQLAEEYINRWDAEGIKQLDADNPIYSIKYMIHRNYAAEYSVTKQFDEALAHLKMAEALNNEYDMLRGQTELINLYKIYYQSKGDYAKMLDYQAQMEENLRRRGLYKDLVQSLADKAFALEHLKRWQEATVAYKEYIHLKDSISLVDFNDKVAELHTKYDIDRLKLENEQMEAKAAQARFRMIALAVGGVILFVIVIVLIYVLFLIQRNRKSLKLAKERAEDADRMKSAFLANMNHEIRTPLNAIVGFSQVLVDEEDKDTRSEYADIIQHNNELLQRLISDVLDLSKLESNSMSLLYTGQNLPDIMRELKHTTQLRLPKEIELIMDPCEPVVIDTDRNRLMQVLTNLLTNAIKYTQEGHVRFGYQVHDANIEFYIEDTGMGISEDKLESVFDRFMQLEGGKKGVGLGLTICKGLVQCMGGKIWVTSIVGKGSTFYVTVPKNQSVIVNHK